MYMYKNQKDTHKMSLDDFSRFNIFFFDFTQENGNSNDTGSRTSEYRRRVTPGVKIKRKRMALTRRGCDVRLIYHDQGIDDQKTIPHKFYRNKNGLILAFDILEKGALKLVDNYVLLDVGRFAKEGTPRLLVGVRTDEEQPRAVSYEQAEAFAKANQMTYHEVDYLDKQNTLDAAVLDLATVCWKNGRFRGCRGTPIEVEETCCGF